MDFCIELCMLIGRSFLRCLIDSVFLIQPGQTMADLFQTNIFAIDDDDA